LVEPVWGGMCLASPRLGRLLSSSFAYSIANLLHYNVTPIGCCVCTVSCSILAIFLRKMIPDRFFPNEEIGNPAGNQSDLDRFSLVGSSHFFWLMRLFMRIDAIASNQTLGDGQHVAQKKALVLLFKMRLISPFWTAWVMR
jgi:hypothetical protein